MNPPDKICIVGSGNWGSAIARIVGENAATHNEFETQVNMWVFEETIGDKKLTDIINTQHENVKYLPGIKLPTNVIAVPDLAMAAKDATILIFVLPHQFVHRACDTLRPGITPNTKAISLIKGMDASCKGSFLISSVIGKRLGIDVSVLSGANIATEVAQEKFCETTVGCRVLQSALVFQKLFQMPYFRVGITDDVAGAELCGALKNVIALAAGFCDGLSYGSNTKAAVIRMGLVEMMGISRLIEPSVKTETFFESCGIADLITTCYGGRNRKCAEAFATTGKPFADLENELLNGQKLQGTLTAKEVHHFLEEKYQISQFPLFNNVYRICYEDIPVSDILKGI